MSHFSANDLVFYKENDIIMSGGYLIDSVLLNQGISPMTTFNQHGGVAGTKVSSIFENLAVPAGLLYTYKKGGSIIIDKQFKEDNSNDIVLSDDIHDQLFKQVDMSSSNKKGINSKSKPKTKKIFKKSKKHSKKLQ